MKKFLTLNDISIYKKSFHLSNYIWKIVLKWDYFTKDTIGKQYIRAIDSIPANIAEGFGRYSYKDKVKFYRYSFGSVMESLDWTQKAITRGLLKEKQYQYIIRGLKEMPKQVNHLINFTKSRLKV